MKKLIVLFAAVISSICTFADDFEVDGLQYTITSSTDFTVAVSGNDGSSSYSIPSTVTYMKQSYSVTSIGSGAFHGCSSLTSINIPSSVTSIGEGAFESCSSLASISVDAGNKVYDSRNNCNAIIETESNTLIA